MGQLAAGDALGCALLLVVVIALVVAFWPYVLTGTLIVMAVLLVRQLLVQQRQRRLLALCEAAQHRLVGDIVLVDGSYWRIEAIGVEGPPTRSRISLKLEGVREQDGDRLERTVEQRLLQPPPSLAPLANHAGFRRFLEGEGIQLESDLSVEAKAMHAVCDCLRELDWTAQALDRLAAMVLAVDDSLAKAQGNELLAASIPAMERASQSFHQQQDSLQGYRQEIAAMLRKLHDFLGVPEALRPVLGDNLEQLIDPQRRRDLQEAFQDVVSLNDAYRQLARRDEPASIPWPAQ